MGSHHGKKRHGDGHRYGTNSAGDADPGPAATDSGADVEAQATLDAAYGRYREARDRYAEAKYEYKAAKYALKAARMRADRDSGRGDRRRGTDRAGGRSVRGQVVMQVVETQRIGEHVQRLTLGGDGFEDFRDNDCTDKYVKILFVDPDLGLEPPYDVQTLRKTLPRHQRPVRRTYTVHSVDPVTRTLAVDVVLHGDAGVAGPWAARAQVGDKVAFSGPGGKFAPHPGADWHLLAGDESALPAIEATLSVLPSDAVGIAFIEVAGSADERALEHPAGVEVQWLHREPALPSGDVEAAPSDDATTARPGAPHTGPAARPAHRPSPLVAAVESMAWRPGRVHAFVHGEKSAVKRLREHLLEERRVDKRMLSLSSYWTRGRSED